MYCSKCGAENKDDSLFCTKCGEKILDVNVKDDKGAEIKGVEKDKTNLFSAHLLNIIAFCLPVLMTLGMFLVIPQMSKNDSDSAADLSVTVEPPDISGNLLLVCFLVGLIIFVIGIIIYLKPERKKMKLAYIYLFLAISDLILAFFLFMLYVLASCGFGVVLFIPGILQIIAGFKFVKAIKMYED